MKNKWYYQTKDFKFHTLKRVEKIEEIFTSEKEMELFFDDKICLGCQIRKNFIEIPFDEKQLRISLYGKDSFIDYEGYTDLLDIFNREYLKIIDSKKSQHNKKSFIDILNIIGLIIIFLVFILGLVFYSFNDLNNLPEEILSVYIIITGIGTALTFPKNLKNFKEGNGSALVNGKGIIGSLFGIVLIIAGTWILIR